MRYGYMLRQAIKDRGMTYAQTGELLGVSKVHINDLIHGKKAPSVGLAVRILHEFGFDPSDSDDVKPMVYWYIRN